MLSLIVRKKVTVVSEANDRTGASCSLLHTKKQRKSANILTVSQDVIVTYQFIILSIIKRSQVVTRATLKDHLVAPLDVAARYRASFLRSSAYGALLVLKDIFSAGVVGVSETDVVPAVGLNHVEDVFAIPSLINTKEKRSVDIFVFTREGEKERLSKVTYIEGLAGN